MYFDFSYIIMIVPALLFSMWAGSRVRTAYAKYQNQYSRRGISGAQAARRVLDAHGLRNVQIQRVSGELTDHYDPRSNIIRLSDSVYDSTSTVAIGVACHEVGHAIQYATDYLPVKFRTAILPVTNIGAKLSGPLIIVGFIMASLSESFIFLSYLGVILFSVCTLFQLVTLPVEFNASRRALAAVESCGILDSSETEGTKAVLSAAALTYVAALAVSLMQLLRFIMILNRRRR